MKKIHHLTVILYLFTLALSAQEDIESTEAIAPLKENTSQVSPDSEQAIVIGPKIFDQRKILSEEQVAKIKATQAEHYKKHQCILSYGLYDGHLPNISVRQKWKDMVSKDQNREFHLFLNIGVFTNSNTIEIDYRYPPALKDTQEIDKVLQNLKQDLQSETGLEALLERSYQSIDDELGYLRNKPEFESNIQKEVNAFEADKLKTYLFKILKIAALIAGPIILIFIIWSTLSKLKNKRPYRFPDVVYIPRFGAKYSATSIAKIKKYHHETK